LKWLGGQPTPSTGVTDRVKELSEAAVALRRSIEPADYDSR
jgi:hypothetical protein